MLKLNVILGIFFLSGGLLGQNIILDGYVYEKGNRGYLNNAEVTVYSKSGDEMKKAFTDTDGHFVLEVSENQMGSIRVFKDMFETLFVDLDPGGKNADNKLFLKVAMTRTPGYIFEITLAEKREDENIPVDAVRGALIEVYNNTKKSEVMVLKDHMDPEFRVNLMKGNHYTILIRKEGYLAKRMEAFVDVKDCILCFEGVGSVQPGVSDNLSEGNEIGVLLANVELERLFKGKKLEIENVYYDLAKWDLKPASREELDKVGTMMSDNPHLTVELGAHTDARGNDEANLLLSQRRARSCVDYLVGRGVARSRIVAKGYGEKELVNDCRDGIECSEAEHARNRRTELKITGIDDSEDMLKSLADMKKAEIARALIDEIAFGSQIKVTEGDTLEHVIEAYENEKSSGKATGAADTLADKMEEAVFEKTIPTGNMDLDTSKVLLEVKEPEIPVEETFPTVDGPKIVIMESESPLGLNHAIYDRHDNVLQFYHKNLYKYLIGDFKDKNEAESFLRTAVKMVYPDAYVLVFDNGAVRD